MKTLDKIYKLAQIDKIMEKKKLPTDIELLQIAKQFQAEHECIIGTAFIRGAKYIINLLNEQENGGD